MLASSLAVATAIATVGAVAPAAAAPDYPTWGAVESARSDEAAKAAEIENITSIVLGLQDAAEAAGIESLKADETATQAGFDLEDATAKVESLRNQARAAEETAERSRAEAAAAVNSLQRRGGADLSAQLFVSGGQADDLLYQLGQLSKIGDASDAVRQQALRDQAAASSLNEQAQLAEEARQRLADEARAAADASQAAANAAIAAVDEQAANERRLQEQLAALKGTTAEVEAEYLAGVRQAELDRQAAAAAAAAANRPSTTRPSNPAPNNPAPNNPAPNNPAPNNPAPNNPAPNNPAPNNPAPPKPTPPPTTGSGVGSPNMAVVNSVLAFARSQIGKMYLMGGAGPDRWDCSGLIMKAYGQHGITFGRHSSHAQFTSLQAAGKLVPLSQAQPGDLLWYSSGGSMTATKYHVMIYTGNGMMIDAPSAGRPVQERKVIYGYGDLLQVAGRPTG